MNLMIEELDTLKNNDTDLTQPLYTLPMERLEQVLSWGGANESIGYVYRPSTVEQLQKLFELARKTGCSIGLRGGGNSYGDAAMNSEQIVLDLSRMNRILAWNPKNGRIQVEPGVTLRRLWEYALADGWWVPVATGTMNITIGGGVAMNVHGKNGWQMGCFGDHIYEFEMLLPNGELIICNRQQHEDIFHAAIGGLGMLGCFVSITLNLKRIYSGLLNVTALTRPNLHETIAYFDAHTSYTDYIVGWLDAFPKGRNLGRSEIHIASHLKPDEDPHPSQTLRLNHQHLPENIMGIVPRSILWRFQKPFWNNFGMRYVNWAKYLAARRNNGKQYQQPHALFHFLLDYFDWKKPFGKGGLIQYQPFIPRENAEDAFREIFQLCHRHRLPNYLSVLKRHRPDDFLLSYGLDGYSLAMDFKITNGNRQQIVKLTQEMDKIVLAANGRFYFAKDSTLRPKVAQVYLGTETIQQFKQLKQRCDPHNLLQTNMWRRIFSEGE